MTASLGCVFCSIVAHEEPGHIRYENEDVVVFDNVLRWAPIMLLAVPREHMSQEEMWSSGVIARVGAVAAQVGASLCPAGFRLLSNFGHAAMQSQHHAHVHVVGGGYLGPYV